jgi:hypothetical protein
MGSRRAPADTRTQFCDPENMTVKLRTRRLLAFLSACGFAACTLAYIGSFFGATMGNSSGWIILLCVGVFALGIPVQILEYPGSRALTFYWKGFARGMPSRVARCAGLLWLIAIAHFAWFTLHSGWGVPAILDGQYVIEARGHILRVLTQAQYLTLQEAWLRGVASIIIACYFMPMMYWWFRRNDLPSRLNSEKLRT